MAEESSNKDQDKGKRRRTGFDAINQDILDNILSRVPALSLAYAACVSRSWNDTCNRILSRPKLASALSLNFSADVAINEVLDKVLSEPIRPHFAIANVRRAEMCTKKALRMISKRLGSKTPIIVSYADGVIGRDVIDDKFEEVKLEDMNGGGYGIVLTVGFVPGLKVDAIPLSKPARDSDVAMAEKFVTDIEDYAVSVSGCKSPVGIILYGEVLGYQKQVIEMLDYAMPLETAIVGDARSNHVYRNANENIIKSSDTVALVFAKDKDKAPGVGEIEFHVAVSNGLLPVGPKHKVVSVVNRYDHATWLTAKREGQQEILDGERILDDINDELENHDGSPDPFIGVTKRRRHKIGSKKARVVTSLSYHGLLGGDQEYLFIEGVGIRTSDSFQFYLSDPNTALSSCREVSASLRNLRLTTNIENSQQTKGGGVTDDVNNKEVFGGLIFACYGRGESFFGDSGVDTAPFLENFPHVPFGGVYCTREIGRPTSSIISQDNQVRTKPQCCLHVYSTVYLVMSYTPADRQH